MTSIFSMLGLVLFNFILLINTIKCITENFEAQIVIFSNLNHRGIIRNNKSIKINFFANQTSHESRTSRTIYASLVFAKMKRQLHQWFWSFVILRIQQYKIDVA